jgi:hypothetical protein
MPGTGQTDENRSDSGRKPWQMVCTSSRHRSPRYWFRELKLNERERIDHGKQRSWEVGGHTQSSNGIQ